MRVLFAGTPEPAVATLQALSEGPHEVVGALTQPDARAGRGRRVVASPVAQTAESLGLDVRKPQNDAEVQACVRELQPDACVVVAYGRLLSQAALDLPAQGWLNLHFSHLPRWRGAAPVQRAIIAGDTEVGASTFRIVRALDAGPVYDIHVTPLGEHETAGDVLDRLAQDGAGLIVRTLDRVEAGEQPTPQSSDGITLAPKLTVEEAQVDFSTTVDTVDRLIRGCTPAPGAWTTFRGHRLKILQASPSFGVAEPWALQVGKKDVLVGTASRALRLEMVQPSGKKPMPAAAWARGANPQAGEYLGD